MNNHLTKCHPDFHIPGDVIVGENFDAGNYVKKLKNNNIDLVVFFAKCHYGYAYYPTEIGTVHPGLKSDMLGDISRNCRKHNLGIAAYYSVFLDTAAARKHPEWLLIADNAEIEGGFNSNKFEPICVNSGYIEELLIPQSLEVIEKYEVDELFYDTMTGFHPCYCSKCVEKFGNPIPLNSDDPIYPEYVKWYKDCYDSCFASITKAIYEKNPEITVTFNWQWSANQPNSPVPHIGRLAGDLTPSATVASFFSHYWAGTGFNFEYMCGRFMHGLGEWSNNLPETLKYTAAATIANGGSFYLIDRQLPDGNLEERSWPLLNDVFGFVKERADAVFNAHHLPETAVLYSYDHLVGRNLEYYPDIKKREVQQAPYRAFAKTMMYGGRHYTALSEETLRNNINKYSTVVLPEPDFLNEGMKELLENFVADGGKLVIIQSKAGNDPAIAELAGINYLHHSETNYAYLESYDSSNLSDPILIRGEVAVVTAKPGTETLRRYISPMNHGKPNESFGHGFAPPDKITMHPLVTERSYKKGKIVYSAAPLLSSHHLYHNPKIANVLLQMTDFPNPYVRVNTPAQVETVLLKKGNNLIINLVNHSGKEVLAGYWCPITEYIPIINDISISVRNPGKDIRIYSIPGRANIDYEMVDGRMQLAVPPLHIMNSICIESYFQE